MLSDQDYFQIFGTLKREEQSRDLTAGPLAVTLQDGNLRTIRFHGHEVLRAAAFLVRDKDWGTCQPVISDLQVHEDAISFAVTYTARFQAPDGAILTAKAHIKGTAQGRLSFATEFSADRDFETARAGFTVLHPLIGLVGEAVTVEHGDGTMESAVWPRAIDPWQPFKDIRAIKHGVMPGLSAETRFEGDIFEMEDQRNWTDGSFKTYVRPLALPWPYAVKAGETIRQSVTVTLTESETIRPRAGSNAPVTITMNKTALRLPDIGIGLRPECGTEDLQHLDVLKDIGAHRLIAHFDPLAGHGIEALKRYAETRRQSGLPLTLELALPCRETPLAELQAIAADVASAGLPLESLFVSPSVDRQSTPPGSRWPDCPPLEDVYAAARAAFPGIRLGGGMMSYFTELNRKRVPGDRLAYVSHCTNPIVHAADDLSVMQTFEALGDVVRSFRALYPHHPYRIGPSTIAMRQNPYGSATKPNPDLARIPMANVDPRHNARFGAAWTLAYAATVAEAGLELLTLSTLTGPFGLVAGPGEPSPTGSLRPLAAVLNALAALSGKPLSVVVTSQPDKLLGLATDEEILMANITPDAVTLEPGTDSATAEDLVSGKALPIAAGRVILPPYATARIRLTRS